MRALALAVQLGHLGALPGNGRTARLWETLATLGALDLGVARAVEPHLDALAILAQAVAPDARSGDAPSDHAIVASQSAGVPAGSGDAPTTSGDAPTTSGDAHAETWGVFAAEGGPDPLIATEAPDGTWQLTGTKPWCSLADRLDRALVSAQVAAASTEPAATARRLFSVDLHHPGVGPVEGGWVARGLVEIPSGPVRFDSVPATAVGDAGWYLDRAGFSWGGIAVAACWFGGAVGIARTLFDTAVARTAGAGSGSGSGASASPASSSRTSAPSTAVTPAPVTVTTTPAPDPYLAMHLGAIDARLNDARRALTEADALVDADRATGADGRLLAKRVRATVAAAAEDVLARAGHALGPAPLAQNTAYAKRVADLTLYLRQHHAERDDASLGTQLLRSEAAPW